MTDHGAPDDPTLTFDGFFHCAECGKGQTELCEHWQKLLKMAVEAERLARPAEVTKRFR